MLTDTSEVPAASIVRVVSYALRIPHAATWHKTNIFIHQQTAASSVDILQYVFTNQEHQVQLHMDAVSDHFQHPV
jgi:hypothetical protein